MSEHDFLANEAADQADELGAKEAAIPPQAKADLATLDALAFKVAQHLLTVGLEEAKYRAEAAKGNQGRRSLNELPPGEGRVSRSESRPLLLPSVPPIGPSPGEGERGAWCASSPPPGPSRNSSGSAPPAQDGLPRSTLATAFGTPGGCGGALRAEGQGTQGS